MDAKDWLFSDGYRHRDESIGVINRWLKMVRFPVRYRWNQAENSVKYGNC